MKKASSIMLIITGICCIATAIFIVIYGVIIMAGGAVVITNYLEEILAEISSSGMGGGDGIDPQAAETALSILVGSIGFTSIFYGIFVFISAFVFFNARKKGTKGTYIASIVFGFMTFWLGIVGGVLGLIANKRDAEVEKITE